MITVRIVNSLNRVNPATAKIGDLFVVPNGDAYDVYRLNVDDQLGGIGSFFKKIGSAILPFAGAIAAPFTGGLTAGLIGLGGSVGGSLLGGSSGGGGQAKGLEAITAYGQQVIAALDSVLQSGQIDAQVLQAAEQLVNSLSDSSRVYQAKKGKDAEALANFKTQGAQKLDQLRAMAAQIAQQQQQQTIQPGGQVQSPGAQATNQSGGILGGIDSNTLILIAGVFGVIYLFKK